MPPPSSSKTSFHPAYSVSNIKNFVQITLEMENVQYASWAELFLNTASAFDVSDHLVPPKAAVIVKDATWTRLDAIVKQWIYSTLSIDLLHTILEPGSTAQAAWQRLKDIFNDNQYSRAVMLEQQFTNTHMDNYPNVSSYCQALKMLADQLSNVGSPVSETRLVLQLVTHVSEGFKAIATIIQQQDPLPSFYKARSMLALEESNHRVQQVPANSDTALLASQSSKDSGSKSQQNSSKDGGNSNNSKGKGGRHNNRGSRGRNNNGNGGNNNNGRNNNGGNGARNGQQQQGTWTWVPYNSWPSVPPCPYPTAGWTGPNSRSQQGILGARPTPTGQAFVAQQGSGSSSGMFVPTDIATLMQSLNVQQPDDNYYMDTVQLKVLSQVLGWVAFVAWSISFYPQALMNFRRKSVVGLNFDFIVLNLTKHSSYLIYNVVMFFSKTVQAQYRHKYGSNQMIPVAANDVAFSIHAVILTAFTLFQIFIYELFTDIHGSGLPLFSESWVNFYGNIGKTLLSLVSIFFDIVFIIQHYMLYPAKKRALPTSQSEIKDTTEFDSKAAAQF
ncbi:hypothetical protein KSS87_023721 [Heliosperma pusillum]|nr:hypothetical protein KSS87_023721 [Heliosperma pusillum]